MRFLAAVIIFGAFITSGGPAFAADPLPKTGAAKLAAYTVCRSAVIVDMGSVGSIVGRVHRRCEDAGRFEAPGQPRDPLPRRRQGATRGLRVHRHMHPDGRRRRQDFHDLSRTQKADRSNGSAEPASTRTSSGSGTWSVADAPGNTSSLFVFTLSYDATWTTKEK